MSNKMVCNKAIDAVAIKQTMRGFTQHYFPIDAKMKQIPFSKLTRIPKKAELFFQDSFFRENLYQSSKALDKSFEFFCHNFALMLLRPDGIILNKGVTLLAETVKRGFEPIFFCPVHIDRMLLRELWRYPFTHASIDRIWTLEQLFGLMPAVLIMLVRRSKKSSIPAAVELSLMKGSTTPQKRRSSDLRSVLNIPNRILSFFHTSDEPADLIRELGILLENRSREKVYKIIQKISKFPKLIYEYSDREALEGLFMSIKKNHHEFRCRCQFKDFTCAVASQSDLFKRSDRPVSLTLIEETVKTFEYCGCSNRTWVCVLLASHLVVPNDENAIENPLGGFRDYWANDSG